MVEDAIRAAQAGSEEAVSVLAEIATDSLLPAQVRVSAARAVLDIAIRGRELIELEERVRALESIVEEARR